MLGVEQIKQIGLCLVCALSTFFEGCDNDGGLMIPAGFTSTLVWFTLYFVCARVFSERSCDKPKNVGQKLSLFVEAHDSETA